MNVADKKSLTANPPGGKSVRLDATRHASPDKLPPHPDSRPSEVAQLEARAVLTAPSVALPALVAPAGRAGTMPTPANVHAAMDAQKASLVAGLGDKSTLNDAAEVATCIAQLHGKPAHAEEVCAMADLLIDDSKLCADVKLAASLVVLGEWLSPTSVMLGGRLSEEDKRSHIFPINARAAQVLRRINGGEAMAQAIEGTAASGITPWLHASRDISAMDAPRKWRQDAAHPQGRLSVEEMHTELHKNDARPGRDPWVTSLLFDRYRTLRRQ